MVKIHPLMDSVTTRELPVEDQAKQVALKQ